MKGVWDSGEDPLAALRNGDPRPFEAFVEAEAPAFVAFFQRLGARRVEAEDLAQDTFVKLFRHAPGYVSEGRFPAFAFRVARNTWIDHTRRAALRPAPPAGGDPGAGAGPERERPGARGPAAALEEDEEARRIAGALARLSEAHRLVFELGVVQELSYAEIAELLEIPLGTVKSRMFHAVRRLREHLGEVEGGAA